MTLYKLGSSGEPVAKIQRRLQALGYYSGALDARFGGATESAVKSFQKTKRLFADGVVGPATWRALFRTAIDVPAILKQPLDHRCVALTGSFETGAGVPDCFAALSGDFDGQGLSFGALQWNFGQRTLQPLLGGMIEKRPRTIRAVFHERFDELRAALDGSQQQLLAFVRSIQHPVTHVVNEPWRGMFRALGHSPDCQDLQRRQAAVIYKQAREMAAGFGAWSERAVALMFDIKVQNGGISDVVRDSILADLAAMPANGDAAAREVERLHIIARRRAQSVNPRWARDVLARKVCIAEGEGIVHGIHYSLAEQFGIRLKAAPGLRRQRGRFRASLA